jgi:hypothetical protein
MIIKRSKIPTILGIILLVVATFAGVFLVNYRQIFRIGATGESEPNDVRVSNITNSSLTISWTTDAETVGFVVWDGGTTEADEKSFTHMVNLSGLEPNTSYDYKINSNGTSFDNNSVAWKASTLAGDFTDGVLSRVSGSVLTATGQPVNGALVYITTQGNLFSTITSDSGNFVIQLPGNNNADTLLEASVHAGPQGVASAQVYLKAANPIPPMILGNTHDFRSATPGQDGAAPKASLNLPEDQDQQSKFTIPDSGTPEPATVVTLESIDNGELVTSQQPEFFGDGPSGTTLTITVESENPITDSVDVGGNGTWKWSPPEGLAPGTHKVTITWKDISGITRSLTRSFVVQAGEAPAFEASGSAQTATPSPKASATSSPKATSTSKSSPTAIASASTIPETGSLTPTFLLSIMGLLVIVFSFAIWKNAESI